MNVIAITPRPEPALNTFMLEVARKMAKNFEDKEGRPGTAVMIRSLVFEIENLREAAKGSLVIVNRACATASLNELRASVLLMIAEKLAPLIDCDTEDWDALQALSGELHAAIRLAKG